MVDYIYYNCEISYNKNGLYVTLFAIEENPKGICLHLPNNDRTDRIMNNFNYNFDKLAHSLDLHNGKLSIIIPPN